MIHNKRRFVAIIELDEDVATKYSETNGICDLDLPPGEYLEHEFGWLEQSGLSLKHWMIKDDDDECLWARYINYLIDFALQHSCEEDEGVIPLSYNNWKRVYMLHIEPNPILAIENSD